MKIPIVAIDARSVGKDHTGDTTYWTGLIQGLSQLDSEIRYLLFSNVAAPPGIPQNDRFQWIELHSHRGRWWSLFRFPLIAKRMGARVFHVQYNLSPLISRGGVTTIHDVSFYHEPEWFRPVDRVVLQRLVPASARRAAKVLTVSEFSRQEILKYISGLDGKVVVSPNACSSQIVPVTRDEARQRVSDELGIDGPFLLTVGTRWPRKNMDLAVQAAELLPSSIPHRMVVTGKPGWGEEVVGERTHFTGFVSSELLSALYSAADLYLAPALYEGFGITLLEAFTCGCPVLASSAGAHVEIAGEGAEIEPSWEPADWAEAIAKLLADPARREAMRQAGLRQAGTYSWEDSARITENVYRQVLGG